MDVLISLIIFLAVLYYGAKIWNQKQEAKEARKSQPRVPNEDDKQQPPFDGIE